MRSRWRRWFQFRPISPQRKLLLAALFALPIVTIFLFDSRGLIKRIQLEMHYDDVHEQLYQERRIGDSLRQQISQLETDTGAIEQIARERYGMVRPGEQVYRVVEE